MNSLSNINLQNAAFFLITSVVLLGSPGPAIAALVAIGRQYGFASGLRYFFGLQVGLAFAAAASTASLVSIIYLYPWMLVVITICSVAYLTWLAYNIATAPLSSDVPTGHVSDTRLKLCSYWNGLFLGLTNPKAYIAFASLMGTYPIVPDNSAVDGTAKWLICVTVMIIVDLAWLWTGDAMGKLRPKPFIERAINILMGMSILIAAGVSLV